MARRLQVQGGGEGCFLRRAVAACVALGLLTVATPALAAASPPPLLRGAREAVLYRPSDAAVLYGLADERPVPVGSLVKLMTARLALQAGTPDRLLEVPDAVTSVPETKAALVPGTKVALGALLGVLVVRSANDAALTIGVGLAGGSAAFVTRMNAEAAAMGLTETHYGNASGLDIAGQHSSARDVAVLAAADMANPTFAALADRSSIALPGGPTYRTVNPFLAFYPDATGIKTGFTSEAMFCLAASATRDGQVLIAVVLGEPNWATTDADAGRLLDWGFARPVAAAAAAAPASQRLPAAGVEAPAARPAPPSSTASASAPRASAADATPNPAPAVRSSASPASPATATTPRNQPPYPVSAQGADGARSGAGGLRLMLAAAAGMALIAAAGWRLARRR